MIAKIARKPHVLVIACITFLITVSSLYAFALLTLSGLHYLWSMEVTDTFSDWDRRFVIFGVISLHIIMYILHIVAANSMADYIISKWRKWNSSQ